MPLEQRTPEWFARRVGKITGSRIAAIKGLSPWQTEDDVLREMIREAHGAEKEFAGNIATRWGEENEWRAIAKYESMTGCLVTGIDFVESDVLPYVGCSPDGLVVGPDGSDWGKTPSPSVERLVEAKCPYNQKIPQEPPAHYAEQVRFNTWVTGAQWGDLFYWTPMDSRLFTLEAPDELWVHETTRVCEAFYERYQAELNNPKHLEPTIEIRDDSYWTVAARRWLTAKHRLDEAKAEEADRRRALEELAEGRSCRGAGVKLSVIQRQGSVDYKAAATDAGVSDFDRYRKDGSTYTRLEEEKS